MVFQNIYVYVYRYAYYWQITRSTAGRVHGCQLQTLRSIVNMILFHFVPNQPCSTDILRHVPHPCLTNSPIQGEGHLLTGLVSEQRSIVVQSSTTVHSLSVVNIYNILCPQEYIRQYIFGMKVVLILTFGQCLEVTGKITGLVSIQEELRKL